MMRALLVCFALGLAACGGGSADTGSAQPPQVSSAPNPPDPGPAPGTVTIRVTTDSGAPIPGVGVDLNGRFDGVSAHTGPDGQVHFTNIPAGEATVHTFMRGFHDAARRFNVAPDTITEQALALLPAAKATPVVLAAHAMPSGDGVALTVDVDIAVLGEDGLANPTFTAEDFRVSGSDCAFMWCVMDAKGAPMPNGGYSAYVELAPFSWHEASIQPVSASSIALLLEHSGSMLDFDPAGLRYAAITEFLDSVLAPDTVAFASYSGTPLSTTLSTHGSFTSDGASFRDDVDALSDADASGNPMYSALGDMLAWTGSQAPGAQGVARSIVLVSGGYSWPDTDCGDSWPCPHELRVAIAEASRAIGTPIVAITTAEPAADIAARSGGLTVVAEHPEQYAVVLENLRAIATRRIGFNRVQLVLNAGRYYGSRIEPVFQSGHTVWASVAVRVSPDTMIYMPVVILVP